MYIMPRKERLQNGRWVVASIRVLRENVETPTLVMVFSEGYRVGLKYAYTFHSPSILGYRAVFYMCS